MMKRIVALLLALMLVFGLVACGGGGEENSSNGNGTENGESAANPIVDFLDEYGDELSEQFSLIMGGGGGVTLTAGTGNELIFTFRFEEALGAEGIEMVLDMIEPTFEILAGEIAEEIGVDSLRLTTHISDVDGATGERSFDS